MKFEMWKTYRHNSGKVMKIVGIANTETYGNALIGEDLKSGELTPVGISEEHAVNWELMEQTDE